MKNKQLDRLNSVYNKRFNKLNKILTKVPTAGVTLFVEHLKHLRDTYIISDVDVLENSSLVTLMAAIKEFEVYQISEDSKHKDFHWKNFCEFLKLNMEEWLKLNDSV